MTTTLIMSELDVAVADAVAQRQHFYTFEPVGVGTRCVICSTAWRTAEEWAKDDGRCPGYTCGETAP